MAGGNPTIVFTQPRQVAIEDREMPSPGEGELLIKTRMTMIRPAENAGRRMLAVPVVIFFLGMMPIHRVLSAAKDHDRQAVQEVQY
jgi:NADPH:quinone reductase-like Zn-dependent oxidoreductase